MEPSDQLAIIVPALIDIVDRLEDDQLDNPTPCAKFTVQGVLDHMMGGAAMFVPAFLGTVPTETTDTAPATPPGRVPADEFRTAMTGLLDSVNAPGAMDRMIDAPFGRVSGSVFARFVAFDGLIHGWDISTAVGEPYGPPSDLVADVSSFAHEALGAELRDGDTFALATAAPAGAGALEQLVAFSGRDL